MSGGVAPDWWKGVNVSYDSDLSADAVMRHVVQERETDIERVIGPDHPDASNE